MTNKSQKYSNLLLLRKFLGEKINIFFIVKYFEQKKTEQHQNNPITSTIILDYYINKKGAKVTVIEKKILTVFLNYTK